MEDQHFIDDTEVKIQKDRPTFLTVLCIITFIVSGILLISSIWSVLTFDAETAQATIEEAVIQMEKSLSQSGNVLGDNFLTDYKTTLEEQIQYHTPLSIIGLVSIILSLLGGFLMFNLKKVGFHLYVVSKLIGFSSILIITINSIMILGNVLMGVLTLAFVIMYAVNLKHMK